MSSTLFNNLFNSVKLNTMLMYVRSTLRVRRYCVNASQKIIRVVVRREERFTSSKITKCFFSGDISQCNGSDSDLEDSKDSDINSDSDDTYQVLRRFLYPDSQDSILLKLNDCASIQAVFDIVDQHEKDLEGYHASQALLILWDLQTIYYKMNNEDTSTTLIPIEQLMEEYTNKVVSHKSFKTVVSVVENCMDDLSPDALTCTFLYLQKMGLPLHRPVMLKLFLHIDTLLATNKNVPLSVLSRFVVTLKDQNSLNLMLSAQNVLPHICENIDRCQSEDEIILLCICLQNIGWLINPDILNNFKSKVTELISRGIFSTFSTSSIVRTAAVFSGTWWNRQTIDLTTKLLMNLKGKTSNMKAEDIIKVHKILIFHLEPADLYAELAERAHILLTEEENFANKNNYIDLLSCVTSFCPPNSRRQFEKRTCQLMKLQLNPQNITSLFKIIRSLKTSNLGLCNDYWSKTLEVMKAYPNERSYLNIGKYSLRYMFFNNNLGGTFRHYEFEDQLIEWYLSLYDDDVIGYMPSKFVVMVAFLIAYCNKRDKTIVVKLHHLVTHLQEMSTQLQVQDCSNLSRGIQISHQLRNKMYDNPYLYNIYIRLNSLLNSCIRRDLNTDSCSIQVTNILMQSYVMRKEPQNTDLSANLVSRYVNYNGHLDSRTLREALFNFLISRCLIPQTLNYFTQYVAQNGEHMFGEIIELLLFVCYYLGYCPSNLQQFLKLSGETIIRDYERMAGLLVLQSCLAMCFFRTIPEKLVHCIFSIDFLERLDQEIANCYSKATYPARIRNYLMQLNRAVCLDFPEFDVPWFHKKYCEEMAVTDNLQSSVFYNDVRDTLIDIVGGKRYLRMHTYSPYGYKLDFEFCFNNTEPVLWKQQSDKNVSRKAVLLLNEDTFSNNVKSANGFYKMKKRHLEMLGYNIVEIEQTIWNSMFMSEPGMKHKFLKEKVFETKCVPDNLSDNILGEFEFGKKFSS